MLKSTSGTEPSLLLHTRDAAPVKSKVAPQLTALQGVDYHSMACTVYWSHHWEGHRCRTGHRTIVDTLYVVITTQVPLHLASLGGHIKKDSLRIICPFRWIVKFNRMRSSMLFHTSQAQYVNRRRGVFVRRVHRHRHTIHADINPRGY